MFCTDGECMLKCFLIFHHFGTFVKSTFSRFHKDDIKKSQMMNVFTFFVNISNKWGIIDINWHTNSTKFEKKCWHDLNEFSKKKCQVQIWSNRWGCVTYYENSLYMPKFPYLSILEPPSNQIYLANFYLLEPFTFFRLEVDDPVK